MNEKEREFLKRLRETFRIEAEEHIRAISAGLIELEKTIDPVRHAEIIETIFREAHSLKGAARSVDLREVESICQPLESAFAALKRQEIALSPALVDLFYQAVDSVMQFVSSMGAEQIASERSHANELIRQLAIMSQGAVPPEKQSVAATIAEKGPAVITQSEKSERFKPMTEEPPPLEETIAPPLPVAEKPVMMETVRIPTAKLDPLLFQAEEMILAEIAASQRVVELHEIKRALASWEMESAKWKDRQSAGGVPEWNEWIAWNAARLNALQSKTTAVTQAIEQDERALRRMVDDHLEGMKKVLMLPISSLVELFPKFVRDLARDQGKEVELVVRGSEIEIDKRIIEELKDPLIHLVRNCVDHGIAKPEKRIKGNKAVRGTIQLAFEMKDGRQVEILVSDDGEGIDLQHVLTAAIKAGILSPDAAGKLTPRETLSLIFYSGLSTSPIITDISGRGLGLAIVREKVEKLGGIVSVDSQSMKGTTFRLLLPLTLTTFKGVLVRVDEQLFVLPATNIERAMRVNREQINTIENRETICMDGQILSTVRLGDVLGIAGRNNGSLSGGAMGYIPIIVLASAEKRIAFQVDEVLGEQQILVKGFGKQLSRVRNIAGATVLGTGKVVPVLNVHDLMKSAVRSTAAVAAVNGIEKTPERAGRILVAEDSITARTLIKNILETAGYEVVTAVDGADAFTKARSDEFDLLVSDVDMPRMNGFELTVKIRSDKKLGEMPVVLVTALESREDRERGIEVGANAYIVKSSFDQSNLLGVIRKLF
jgi:two-component system, chemotaxis family, sensor kinase CheA